MSKLVVETGATSVIVPIFIQDSSSTTGAGKTGLAYNTASLTAYYVRPGSAATAITLATQTVTGAYSSGGFVEIDSTNMPGWYRLDIPNACFSAGVRSVGIALKGATNMAPCNIEVELQTAIVVGADNKVVLSTDNMTEAYPVDGQSGMSAPQALYAAVQLLTEFSRSGTTITVKKRDGTTTAFTLTLDSGTAPTSSTQAT